MVNSHSYVSLPEGKLENKLFSPDNIGLLTICGCEIGGQFSQNSGNSDICIGQSLVILSVAPTLDMELGWDDTSPLNIHELIITTSIYRGFPIAMFDC
jgi:hypothetical protein